MATIQIEVLLDEKGVVTGVQNVNQSLDLLGNKANAATKTGAVGMEQLGRQTRDAANMADLLAARFGVTIPGGLTHMMAKFPAVAAGIKVLAGAAGGFILAFTVMDLVNGLDKVDSKLRQVGNTWAEFGERVRGWFTGQRSDTAVMNEVIAVNQLLKPLDQAKFSAQAAANMAGLEGYAQITQARKQALEQLQRDTTDALAKVEKDYTRNSDAYKSAVTQAAWYGKDIRLAIEKEANAQLAAQRRQHVKAIEQIELEASTVGLTEISKLRAQQEHDAAETRDSYKRGVISFAEYRRSLTAIDALEANKEKDLNRKALESDVQARLQAEAAGAKGTEQIRLELIAQLQQITMKERETGIALPGERLKAEKEAAAKIADLRRDAVEGTLQMEAQAALAIVPPWERANAEIYVSAAQRVREIQQAEQMSTITSADAARRTAAVWTEAAGKVLDEWTSAFEDLFNGGISSRIEQNVKKFAARLAAQFTLQSGMGGILAPFLGLSAPGMTNAGFGATMGGSTASLGGLIPGIAGGVPIPGMTGTFGGSTMGAATLGGLTTFGPGGSVTGGMTADQWLGAQPSGTTASNQLLAAMGGLNITRANTGTGLLSMKTLSNLVPLLAAMGGGKLGGTAGMIGAGVLGTMIAGPSAAIGGLNSAAIWLSQALGISAGAAAGIMVGVGAGLLGFGIGQQYGKLPGILSGGASGALLGLAFGGPIGALIGGILGLLGGLFGGLLGGSQRRKQAEQYAAQQAAEIDKIVAAFKGFQIDYGSATTQLQQMRTNAQTELGKLKGEGRKVFDRTLAPKFDSALSEINSMNKERERRMGLVFGPPEFASGGYTGRAGAWRMGNGFLAVLHPEEFVANQQATQKFRPQLEDMNRGIAPSGGDGGVVGVYATDGKVFAKILLREGLWREIKSQATQDSREGRW